MLTSDAAHMRNRFGFNARRARSSTGVRCQTARCRKRVAARKNACRRRPCVRAFGDFAKSIAGARGGDGCVRLHQARHRRARCKNNSSHLSVARVSIHFNTTSISRGLDSIVLVSAACWRLRLLSLISVIPQSVGAHWTGKPRSQFCRRKCSALIAPCCADHAAISVSTSK